jgi:hypothetical protein
MSNVIGSYMTPEGYAVIRLASGKRMINGLTFAISSLTDQELATTAGLQSMPPLDSPSIAGYKE